MELDLERLAEQEAQAYALFRQKYLEIHPPPSARGLGWQFYALVLTSLAAVVLAALRTADQFYRAAQLAGSEWLARAEAVSVLFAIEGGIVLYSAIRASEMKNIGLDKMKLGIIIMVIISTFAGLGQSLNLVDGLDPRFAVVFEYALSFVIGVGASIVAWIGGEVLGGQIAAVGVRADQDASAYRNGLLKAWNASPERKLARGELMDSVRGFSAERSVNVQRPATGQPQHFEESGKRDEAFAYIDDVLFQDGQLPGPTELARALGIQKSSAHYFLKKWGEKNGNAEHR